MLRVKLTSRGAEGMTTVWRPRVRIPVPDIDGADADENRRDESTKKGTKRKRAPYTKGPCEHGVKKRSKCKVCSACPHGRRRSRCKECGGHKYASTVVSALSARSAVGSEYASTVVSALVQGVRWVCNLRARSSALLDARSAVVHQSASTVVSALGARSAVGVQSASTVVSALSARSAVVHQYASTVVGALTVQGVRWVGGNLRARSSSL